MKTKHTPGPWFYQTSSNTGFLINSEEFPYEDEESCIAYLPDIDYAENIDENERDEHPRRFPEELLANARLIAAAPEMYEALQKCLFFLHCVYGHKDTEDPFLQGAFDPELYESDGREARDEIEALLKKVDDE